MMDNRATLLLGFETHSVELIRKAIAGGLEVNKSVEGKAPLDELIEMYFRSPAFSDCVACLVESGARFEDKTLLAVLLNDGQQLRDVLRQQPDELHRRLDLRCAFTPLIGATLLHVACEFGLSHSVAALLEAGADVEARARFDAWGFNGHTAIFHTVCQHANHGLAVMRLLLDHGARTDVRLSAITWGQSFPWATTIFDPTPVSYAQAGLFRQFQRDEIDVYRNIRLLMQAAKRPLPDDLNVPNAYLGQ
jgi:hypothetical protein